MAQPTRAAAVEHGKRLVRDFDLLTVASRVLQSRGYGLTAETIREHLGAGLHDVTHPDAERWGLNPDTVAAVDVDILQAAEEVIRRHGFDPHHVADFHAMVHDIERSIRAGQPKPGGKTA